MSGTGTIGISLASNVDPSSFGQGVVWTATVTGSASLGYINQPYGATVGSGFTNTLSASLINSPFLGNPRLQFPSLSAWQISISSGLGYLDTGSAAVNVATAFYSFRFQEVSKTGEAPVCEIIDTNGGLKFRLTASGANFIFYDSTGTAQGTVTSGIGTGTHTITIMLGTGAAAAFEFRRDGTLLQTGTINAGTVNNGGIRLGSSSVSGTYVHNYQWLAIGTDCYPFQGPSGTIQFQVDGSNFGSAVTLTAQDSAVNTVVTTSLPVTAASTADFALTSGNHTITAIYNGDNNYTSVTSAGLVQSLNVTVAGLQHNTAVPALANAGVNPLLADQAGHLLTNPLLRVPVYGSAVGLVNFTQTAATDIAVITGSASKTVKVLKVKIEGICTADAFAFLQLILRSSANTGGSPFTASNAPYDLNNANATATLKVYNGTNATTLGTAAGTIRAERIFLAQTPGVVTVTNEPGRLLWDFTTAPVVLRGTAQQLCVNANGTTLPAGNSLDFWAEWIEDDS